MKVKSLDRLLRTTVNPAESLPAGLDPRGRLYGRKLTVLKHATGWPLVGYSVWAFAHYGGTRFGPYLWSGLIGLVIVGLPTGLARLKLWGRRAMQVWNNRRGHHSSRGYTFVSTGRTADRSDVLERVSCALETAGSFDGWRRSEFPEGEGLEVRHSFHNAFVRVSGSGRVVVTGTSFKAADLADLVGEAVSMAMNRRPSNPLLRPAPVRGAPRALLGVFLVVLLVVGMVGVAEAAYPSPAYNPAEKTVLVSYDLRADFAGPEATEELRISKAAFLARVLDEKSVEIRWSTSMEGVRRHAEQSLVVRRDAIGLIEDLRREPLTAEQHERLDAIEGDLAESEREVAAALADEAASAQNRESRAELAVIRESIVATANATSTTPSA